MQLLAEVLVPRMVTAPEQGAEGLGGRPMPCLGAPRPASVFPQPPGELHQQGGGPCHRPRPADQQHPQEAGVSPTGPGGHPRCCVVSLEMSQTTCDSCLSSAPSLAANLLYDEGGKAIALAMKENRALTSLQ